MKILKFGCAAIAGLFALIIVVGIVATINEPSDSSGQDSVLDQRTPPSRPRSLAPIQESCGDLSKRFGLGSELTDLQKKEEWKTYEGRHFTWNLQVSSVDSTLGNLAAQFKCEHSKSYSSDILLSIDRNNKDLALSLKKGAFYKVDGTLSDWGNFMGLSGRLISIAPSTP